MRLYGCFSHRDFPHGARADELRLGVTFEDAAWSSVDVHANLLKTLLRALK